MDRATMVSQLMAAMPNFSQAVIDTMTDDQLAEMVKNLPAPPAAAAAPPAAPAPAMMADRQTMIDALVAVGQDPAALEAMDDPSLQALYDQLIADQGNGTATPMADVNGVEMSREEMIAALVAQGQDEASLQAMTDDELAQMLAGMGTAPAATPAAATPMSDRSKKPAKALTFAERQANASLARIKAHERVLAMQAKRAKQRAGDLHKQNVSMFCDQLVKEGRLLPVQRPAVESMLVRLDDVNPVLKYSEGGRVRYETAFERKKRELRGWPVLVRFGERPGLTLSNGAQGHDHQAETAELQKVQKFAEVYADQITKGGIKPEVYVSRFVEMRKKNPALTARKYGVPAEMCG